MVIASKEEALGRWTEGIITPAIFLKPKDVIKGEQRLSEPVWAIVFCHDTNMDLIGVVVETNRYYIQKDIPGLLEVRDIISTAHHTGQEERPAYRLATNALMLHEGRWRDHRTDGISNPVDQIPVF